MSQKLPVGFYRRDTVTVARELLGQRLVHRLADGAVLSGRIVETEAYLGADDPACHTYGYRRTPRTETMYRAGGVAYVYLIYGMHFCLNAVTRYAGEPEAVLIRALAPDAAMRDRHAGRFHGQPTHRWLNGPGKLCKGLGITRDHNGLSLRSAQLFIEAAACVATDDIVARPRIGVDYAGEAAQWPLRFYVRDEPSVSKP